MKIVTDNNLLYEDFNEHCKCILTQANGYVFAFVQAIDLGTNPHKPKVVRTKRYWGMWDVENPKASMERILRNGGKWPKLPE